MDSKEKDYVKKMVLDIAKTIVDYIDGMPEPDIDAPEQAVDQTVVYAKNRAKNGNKTTGNME